MLLNPALAWLGAAAVSVPIIIHLLNKRKFEKVVWAAMRFLRVVIFSRVSRSPGVTPLPRGCCVPDGRWVDAESTSGFDTTPPLPVPATAAISIPRSSAIRRAAGDDLVVSLGGAKGGGDEARDVGG